MSDLRLIRESFFSCSRRWVRAPRVLLLFGFIVCLTVTCAVPFAANARLQGEKLQFAEIWIALMNWRFSMLAFSTIVIFLFGELPIVDPFSLNTLLRGTRRLWLAGQILYVLADSLVLCLLILASTLLAALPNLTFSNEWSRPVRMMAYSGRIAIPPEQLKLSMSAEILELYSPWAAFGHSAALFYLLCCLYGLSALALRIQWPSGGFIQLVIANVLSWSMGALMPTSAGYAVLAAVSPHYHASLSSHFVHSVNPYAPTLEVSYGVLLGVILGITVFASVRVKRYDFCLSEGEQE